MKINRRLINISIICLIAALAMTYIIYQGLQKSIEPEQMETVVVFKRAIENDTLLRDLDCELKEFPISLVPKNAVKSLQQINDKRLIGNSEQGEVVFLSRLAERGDVSPDVKGMWTIGLDVVNISNYLGCNIKEGKDYVLLYKDVNYDAKIIAKVRIANMVDGVGKTISQNAETVIKTINVSVLKEEEVKRISKAKETGKFDLVEAPDGFEIKVEEFDISKPQTQSIIGIKQ